MRVLSDVLSPRLSDILKKLDELLEAMKKHPVFTDPETYVPPFAATVISGTISPADMATAYLATGNTGLVRPRTLKIVNTVAPAAVLNVQHLVPAGFAATFIRPVGVWATAHSPLITVNLQIDGMPDYLSAQPLQTDVDLEFFQNLVVRQEINFSVTNASALPTTVTLYLPMAEVVFQYYYDYWLPILQRNYQNLLRK